MDTSRCMQCDCPDCDHVDQPLRYVLKASMRHYLLGKIAILSRGWRPDR